MSLLFHASRPRGSIATANDSCAPGAAKSSRAGPAYSRATSASDRTPPANGSIVTRPHIHPSAVKLAWICSYSRRTAGASGHLSATMRPSMDAAMWQITRGRGDSVYRSGSAIRHHDRFHHADEDEGRVAYDRHTGSARKTVLHDAHFRTIPVDRQLSDTPLPLGLDQCPWT